MSNIEKKLKIGNGSDASTCSVRKPWFYRLIFSKIEYVGKRPIIDMNGCDEIISIEKGSWRRYRIGWELDTHYWRVYYRSWLPIKTLKKLDYRISLKKYEGMKPNVKEVDNPSLNVVKIP